MLRYEVVKFRGYKGSQIFVSYCESWYPRNLFFSAHPQKLIATKIALDSYLQEQLRQLTFELHLLSIFVFQAIKITTKNKRKKDGGGVSKIKLVSTREERVTPQFRRPNFNFFLILSYFSMKKFAKYNLSLKPKLKNQYIYLRFPGDFSMFQQHTC